MSKSRGNVIDPMEIINEYGSDAFRMGIIAGESAGSNRPFDRSKVVGARNFCNKLWNIARFIEDKVGDEYAFRHNPVVETAADAWIHSRLRHVSEGSARLLEQYRFSEAYDALYHFVWNDFADWYIEASKADPNKAMLAYCLDAILRLCHPFAPFVTETIWQTLKWEDDSLLITSHWPEVPNGNTGKEAMFEEIKSIVSEIRYIRSLAHLQSGLSLYHSGDEFIKEHGPLLKSLANLDDIRQVRDGHGLHLTGVRHEAWLDIDQETADAVTRELGGKKEAQTKRIAQLEGRLSNKSYITKAPKQVVKQTREELAAAKELLAQISAAQSRFSGSK